MKEEIKRAVFYVLAVIVTLGFMFLLMVLIYLSGGSFT